jgi:hypothetical protein
VVSFKPRPFYPQGKSPCCPLNRRLVGPKTGLEAVVKEKNSQSLPRLEPPIFQRVAQRYTAELYRLLMMMMMMMMMMIIIIIIIYQQHN